MLHQSDLDEGWLLKTYFLFICILFLAFTALAQARPLNPISENEVVARLAQFDYVPWDGESRITEVKQGLGCLKVGHQITINDPITHASRTVSFVLSLPAQNKPVPLTLIVPSIRGPSIYERSIANHLCGQGMASIVADVLDTSQPRTFPAWGFEDKQTRDSILAIRTILDFAEQHPSIDKNKLALLGISVGGVIGTMVAEVEPIRLKALITVVSGGNLAYTLSHSIQRSVAKLRNSRMASMHWTDPSQYDEKLRETIKFDPIYFASRLKADKILMVMGTIDRTIPYVVQDESLHAYKDPQHLFVPMNHIGTIFLFTAFHLDQMDSFLHKRFAAE